MWTRFYLLAVLLISFVLIPFSVSAIGISPILFEEIIPDGQSKEVILNIVRGHPDTEEQVELRFEGPVALFVKAKQGKLVTLPKGEKITPIKLTIALPKGTQGVYTGVVRVMAGLGKTEGNAVQVGFEARIHVTAGIPTPPQSQPAALSSPPAVPAVSLLQPYFLPVRDILPVFLMLIILGAGILAGWQLWKRNKR